MSTFIDMIAFFVDISAVRSMLAITSPNRSNPQMASRTAPKSTALPVKKTAVISYVRELPGAVFFSDAMDAESIDYAVRLQRIRASYENDGCQEMLWHDLSQMGFDSKGIRQFVVNPAAITNCGYGDPIPLR
jgi:hypothetical protein